MTVIESEQSAVPVKKSRHGMLPLLIVLFVVSYAILTMLVVYQGRTIDAQRGLIREMMKDSMQLAKLKGQMARDEAAARAQNAPPANPETKDSGPQSVKPGNPAAPGNPAHGMKPNGKSRTTKEVPETPAADLQDVRRAKQVI